MSGGICVALDLGEQGRPNAPIYEGCVLEGKYPYELELGGAAALRVVPLLCEVHRLLLGRGRESLPAPVEPDGRCRLEWFGEGEWRRCPFRATKRAEVEVLPSMRLAVPVCDKDYCLVGLAADGVLPHACDLSDDQEERAYAILAAPDLGSVPPTYGA